MLRSWQGVGRSQVVLFVGALFALSTSLAGFLLTRLLWVRLQVLEQNLGGLRQGLEQEELRLQDLGGQGLEDSQLPGLLDNFPEVPGWSFLPLIVLGLAVVASLALVVLAAVRLLDDGSRLRRSSCGPATVTPQLSGITSTNPLNYKPHIKLVEECVDVVDELDRHMASFDAPRRELADHVMLRLREALERSGVEVISDDVFFDRGRHKPAGPSARDSSGAVISEILSPGFAIGQRVLRRARVRVE